MQHMRDSLTCKLLSSSNMISELNHVTNLLTILLNLIFRMWWKMQHMINCKCLQSLVRKCSVLDYVNKLAVSCPFLAVTEITPPGFLLAFSNLQIPNSCRAGSRLSSDSVTCSGLYYLSHGLSLRSSWHPLYFILTISVFHPECSLHIAF